MADDKLFRKAALEKLASPERLDVLMQVTSPLGWVALWTVAFVLGAVLVWGVFGSVPERIDGQGILIRGGGLREIRASGEGVLATLAVKLNDTVANGQTIGEITFEGTENAIDAAQLKLDQAQREYEMGSLDDRAAISGLRANIAGQEADINRTNADLARTRDDLAFRQQQLKDGLTTAARVEAIRRDASALEARLTSLRATINSLNAQISSADQRIRARQRSVDAARLEVDNTNRSVASTTQITATVEGRIVEVLKSVGDRVRNGEVLALVEPPGSALEPVVFVNSATGKRIRPGMEAQISPSTVKREEYGFMKGTVRFVGDFPVTPEAAMNTVQNSTLVQELIGTSAKIEMRTELLPDPDAASGYQWSSSSGPPFKVDSGTRVTVSVVVDRRAPISYVLPIIRGTFGAS